MDFNSLLSMIEPEDIVKVGTGLINAWKGNDDH